MRQWATYYGGNARDINNNSSEWGNLICVDSQNNIYIAGTTSSTNFPLQQLNGAYWQGSFAGGSDAFILKFNNQGVRQWATYYGGGGIEDACAICVDHQDNICITGSTVSNNFPTQQLPGAYWQSSLSDSFYYDIFIIKFNDQGARQWATYYGGTIDDHGYSIFADNIDNIYVIGNTTSTDFPIQQLGGEYFQAVCSNIGGNTSDAFILEFNKHGVRQYATYYGSNGSDMGKGIAVDSQNSIYFIGTLGDSTAFTVDPGNGAYYENSWHSGDIWWDGFILKIKCNITNPTSIKSDRNYLCSLDNGTITLMAIGGSGDSLKWYTGGCGQTYIGSGINITIPTPTQTTTYYACWESECGTSACVNIVIYVYDVFYTYLNPIICQNESFSVGIHNYSLIGIYNDTLQTLSGCDSIITTNLFVNPIPPPPIISQTYNLLNSNASAGNQWYNQDGIMVGDTNQNLNLIVNGDYYVIVILNGCVSDTSNVLHITNVGVSENESNSNINIYPNPVSMELIIEAKGNKEKIEFEILNAIGQVVYKGSLLGEIIVQTKGFAQGMYMVKLGNGKRFEFRKVLKN